MKDLVSLILAISVCVGILAFGILVAGWMAGYG